MPRNPARPARCKLADCDRPHEAKGYCKRHYRRWRAYGDPLGSGRVGGTATIPDELRHSGLTYRQLRYWCEQGFLQAPVDPSGRARTWTPDEVRIALIMRSLAAAGLPLNLAAQAARRAVAGEAKHPLAPGVRLDIDVGKATAP